MEILGVDRPQHNMKIMDVDLSHWKHNLVLSIVLVNHNRDPGSSYIMVYENNPPHNWVMFSPRIYIHIYIHPKQAGGPLFSLLTWHQQTHETFIKLQVVVIPLDAPEPELLLELLAGQHTSDIRHLPGEFFISEWSWRKKKRIAVWQLINHTAPTFITPSEIRA